MKKYSILICHLLAVVVAGGTLLLALAWFYTPVYGGKIWFKGPVSTVMTKDSGDVDIRQVNDSHSGESDKASVEDSS